MKTSIESYSSVPLINSGSVSEFGKGGLHRFSESMVDIRKKGLHLFCTCKHSLFSQNRVDPKKLDSEELMRFLILARFHGRMLCKKPSLHLCCMQRLPICRWASLRQQPQQQVALGSGFSFTGGKDGACRHYSRPIEREKTSEQPALTSLACWGFVLTCGLCDNI